MAKPFSTDLRERVISAVVSGRMSRRQAAAHFEVGVSTVIDWVARFRKTGSVEPCQIGGYRQKLIRGEYRVWLLERVQTADFTLRGLVAELAERGLKVDYKTMWTFVHDEKLSFKKNRISQRTRSS
jgi:putative transposase